jgi:hypothetical protein
VALKKLEHLTLDATKVAAVNLKYLADLPSLHSLYLGGAGTTSETLQALAHCKRLTNLHLADFAGTEEAFQTFVKAMPDCRIRCRIRGGIY